MRQILRGFGLGLLTVAAAIAGGVLIDALVNGGWSWPQFAMVLIAASSFVLATYQTTYGLGAPGQVVGYELSDSRDGEYIVLEAETRRETGTFSEYRAELGGGCAAIIAMAPPVVVFIYLAMEYGIESPL